MVQTFESLEKAFATIMSGKGAELRRGPARVTLDGSCETT
jgi:hypothetical protein